MHVRVQRSRRLVATLFCCGCSCLLAEGFYQSSEQSNLLMPSRVDERVIRVYSRRREPEVIREISKGFRKLLREHM